MSKINDEQREILSKKARFNQQEKFGSIDVSDPNFEGYGFDVHSAILDEHIFSDHVFRDFAKDQAKLRLLNPLSGKVFNPVGFAMNLKEDITHPSIQQFISQGISDLVGSGAFETNDGKTFSSAFDTNYDGSIYGSVEDFKEDVEANQGFIGSVLSSAKNKVRDALGDKQPTRSILGQVIAYQQNQIDKIGSQSNKLRTYLKGVDGSDQPDRTESSVGATKIDGVDTDALNYLYSNSSAIINGISYIRTRQKMRNGFFSANIRVKKHDDIVRLESELNNTEDNDKNKKSKFGKIVRTRIYKLPAQPKGWYENWKFDFSKDYPSPYKIFFGVTDEDSDSDIQEHFIDFYSESLPFDSVSDTGQTKRLDRIKNPIKSTKGEYPIYDISKKFSIYSVNGENDNDLSNLYDIRHLKRFIDDKQKEIKNPEDEIQSTGIFREPHEEFNTSLFLSFQDIRTGKIVYFRPAIDSITTDIQPTYEEENFLGRTESLPSYQRTNKNRNFSFKMYCSTPKEQLLNIKKLNFLDSLCYPIINDDFSVIQNPLVRINLGTYFNNSGGYITSMTHTINNDEAGWTIDSGSSFMAPKIIDVSISMVLIHNRMPYYEEGETFESQEGETDFQNNYGINYTELLGDD